MESIIRQNVSNQSVYTMLKKNHCISLTYKHRTLFARQEITHGKQRHAKRAHTLKSIEITTTFHIVIVDGQRLFEVTGETASLIKEYKHKARQGWRVCLSVGTIDPLG